MVETVCGTHSNLSRHRRPYLPSHPNPGIGICGQKARDRVILFQVGWFFVGFLTKGWNQGDGVFLGNPKDSGLGKIGEP